jgi:holin-like protein
MIEGFLVLLLFQLAGEALAHIAHVSIPGPIIGLLLMLLWVRLGGKVGEPAAQVARGLLANLGLMFVPVAAGISFQLRALGNAAWHVGWIVVVSTVITLLVTAAVFAWLSRVAHSEDKA